MNSPFMTEEERWRAAYGNTASPMMNQTAQDWEAQARNLESQQARLLRQQAAAQKMMDSSMGSPELIRAGNVSAAGANPLSAMAQAIRGGTGAYLNIKTAEQQKDVDAQQAEADAAAGRAAFEKEMYGRGTDTRDYLLEERKANETAENNRLTRAAAAAETARKAAADARDREQREMVSFHSRQDPTRPVHFYLDDYGNMTRADGTLAKPEEYQGLVPWDLEAIGSADTAKEAAEFVPYDPNVGGQGVTKPDLVVDIFTAGGGDLLHDATGVLDPDRWTGVFGYSLTGGNEKGDQIQSLQKNFSTALIDGTGARMEEINLKPMSDPDRKFLGEDLPTANTQPYGWVDWGVNRYRALLNKKFDEGIAAGTHTESQKLDYMFALDKALASQALHEGTNYPIEKLLSRGVSEEAIVAAKVEQQQARAEKRRLEELRARARQ